MIIIINNNIMIIQYNNNKFAVKNVCSPLILIIVCNDLAFVWRKGEGCTRFLVGKPEGKRPLGRPRRKWEDNIKMDLDRKSVV
jgi:hypothetical protein